MAKKLDIFKVPVFEAADVFPMLDDDDLETLSEDIAENGLQEPIVLAEVGDKTVLVDGRNRRAACKLAKVDPEYVFLDGQDPTAYVISANIHRRHMTKSQRAMAVAMVYPEAEQGRRTDKGKRTSLNSKEVGASPTLISQARTILREAPDLARQVLAGVMPVHKALEEAEERTEDEDDSTGRLRKLKKRYSDLADLVSNEEMSFEEAEEEADDRDEQNKNVKLTLFDMLNRVLYGADSFSHASVLSDALKVFSDKKIRDEFENRYRGGPDDFEKSVKAFRSGVDHVFKLLDEVWDLKE